MFVCVSSICALFIVTVTRARYVVPFMYLTIWLLVPHNNNEELLLLSLLLSKSHSDGKLLQNEMGHVLARKRDGTNACLELVAKCYENSSLLDLSIDSRIMLKLVLTH